MRNKIEATVAIVDLRNFTMIFEDFQHRDDEAFLNFLEKYYSVGIQLADLCTFEDNTYKNTTGDGYMIVFMGEHHEHAGYLYGLLLNKILLRLVDEFKAKTNIELSYGIGIETGFVQQVH